MMRPRGTPPMPRARSSDSAPVGIACTRTCAPGSPMRMTVPLPNSRSICVSAPCRAASRALMASSSSVAMGLRTSLFGLRERCSVAAGSDGTRPYGCSCHGSRHGLQRKCAGTPARVRSHVSAVLFDLDGVLVDSRAAISGAINHALGVRGLPQHPAADLHRFIGPPLAVAFAELTAQPADSAAVVACVTAYRERYAVSSLCDTTVVPGIPEALAELSEDHRLAV